MFLIMCAIYAVLVIVTGTLILLFFRDRDEIALRTERDRRDWEYAVDSLTIEGLEKQLKIRRYYAVSPNFREYKKENVSKWRYIRKVYRQKTQQKEKV